MPRRCQQLNCEKQSKFGLVTDKSPKYCGEHKKEHMVDILSKKCLECTKRPSFGLVTDKSPKYCGEHKKEHMVDIVHKKCLECTKQAYFGLITDKRPKYCSEHKKTDMIDILSKKCQQLNCKKQPSYGLEIDSNPTFCNEHKTQEMVNIVSKQCQQLNCKTQPSYGLETDSKPKYCATHKTPGMIDIQHKRCITPLCGLRTQPKHKGYCSRCYYYTFPNEPHSRNYKTKELMVTDYIKDQKFEEVKMQFDKVIPNGCSKRRPDILIDCLTHVIIVEIDENSHRQYESTCENKRICELYQDFGFANIVFIRFNPDAYTNSLNKKISSCFKIEKQTGKCVLNDKKQWNLRLLALKQSIQNNINNIPSKSIQVEYLYYDEI